MRPRETVGLRWRKPPEWDRFIETVADNHRGYTSPYAGLVIEQAWDEYREVHPSEELVDRLADAAGVSRGEPREKNLPTRDPVGGSGRTNLRVLRSVRDEMAAAATEMGVENYEVLRAVVNWYLDGGRESRIADKLERAIAPAVKALTAVEGQSGGLTKGERIEIAIAQQLGDQFTRDELHDAIDDETSGSDYYHDEYVPRVIERKAVEPHPNNPDLFVSTDVADAIRAEKAAERDDEVADQRGQARAEVEAALESLEAATDGGEVVED